MESMVKVINFAQNINIYRAIHRKMREDWLWNYYFKILPDPKIKSKVSLDPHIENEITQDLQKNGFNIYELTIDIKDYERFLSRARYDRFPHYYSGGSGDNFPEKSLEHYLASTLLALNHNDIYIDVASGDSPTTEIYENLFGCKAYRQDLNYPEGIHNNTIGCDAGEMPVEDNFASKMALHCSFEHFEQDSDIRFIKEIGRVLRPGGKACILPLYLFTKYVIQTDPSVLPKDRILFENDSTLYAAKGWGNRHGRFYDVPHLIHRVRDNMEELNLSIYIVQNEKEVHESCYIKFIAVFEKKQR